MWLASSGLLTTELGVKLLIYICLVLLMGNRQAICTLEKMLHLKKLHFLCRFKNTGREVIFSGNQIFFPYLHIFKIIETVSRAGEF